MQPKSRAQLFAELAVPADTRWRGDPVAWATERAGLELWSKQREILESVVANRNTAVRSCHSAGKGLWVETPLPTPTGWMKMGSVAVGDLLYDETGEATRVVAVSEVRYLDCYRVTFTDGASLIADGDHLWSVLSLNVRGVLRRRRRVDDWRNHWDSTKTLNTRELRGEMLRNSKMFLPGIPLARTLNTGDSDVDLLIPPYVLGAWLGDGMSTGGGLSNDPRDDEIVEQIKRCGWLAKRGVKFYVGLRTPDDKPMVSLTRRLNLVKNKHIPAVYLRASRAQRLELLRGLIDTDGCIVDGSCAVGFKSERLARDTYELVRSLGWRASFRRYRASVNGKDCGYTYRVKFTSDEVPCHLTRKAARWHAQRDGRRTIVTIKSIEPVATVPTRCVTVDSPRGLYLAGESMTVTHNSFIASVLTCWWLDTHPRGEARVITTAPTSKQVDAVLWHEINKLHLHLGLYGRTNRSEWWDGRQLVALGRKPPDHIEAAFQGLHARYLLAILDEAYGIPKNLWDEASTLASNEYGRILAIGNPDGPGEFEETCREDSGWNVIHIGYQHTPNVTGEVVSPRLRELLISPVWVEERRKKWGPESALFQAKIEGNFPSVGSPWQVVPLAWANQCRFLELADDSETPTEAGVDVGAGNDRTVVTIRRGPVILHIQSFIDSDPVKTVGAVALLLREWGVQTVKVDSIGVGWGVYGHLRALSSRHETSVDALTVHDASVVPVNVGQGPTYGNEHRFLNRRAELWLDIGRENSRLKRWDLSRLPRDLQNTLVHELTMPQYQILDSKGKVKIEPKEKIIERLGSSPDVAESVLLAFVPASWTAELQSGALLEAPSLLGALSPSDLLSGGRGGVGEGLSGPNGGLAGSGRGAWSAGERSW